MTNIDDDDEDFEPSSVAATPPSPTMIPVKQFTAYTGSGDSVEIVGVHLQDEETNFVAIVSMDDGEIFPQVIHYSVFKSNE